MTDEELQGLVKDLREASDWQVQVWARLKAANEIERLTKERDEARDMCTRYANRIAAYRGEAKW